jgi:hypothetical protein
MKNLQILFNLFILFMNFRENLMLFIYQAHVFVYLFYYLNHREFLNAVCSHIGILENYL